MRNKAVILGSLAALVGTAGCYHEATMYGPPEMEGAAAGPGMQQAQPPPVSTYPIPPSDPKGTVYVMSLGPEHLVAGPGRPEMYLHVRIAAENNSDGTAWQIDPNDEVVGFGNGQGVAASFAQASSGGPVLNVARGGRGDIDLYYALPPSGQPGQVALSWRVHRGADTVAQTTSFERIAPRGAADGYAYYQPYGPDVHLAVGLDWWWPWPWYWGWGVGPWWHYPYFGYYGGYRGFYGGYGRYYGGHGGPVSGGSHGGASVAPAARGGGGGWRGGGGHR